TRVEVAHQLVAGSVVDLPERRDHRGTPRVQERPLQTDTTSTSTSPAVTAEVEPAPAGALRARARDFMRPTPVALTAGACRPPPGALRSGGCHRTWRTNVGNESGSIRPGSWTLPTASIGLSPAGSRGRGPRTPRASRRQPRRCPPRSAPAGCRGYAGPRSPP